MNQHPIPEVLNPCPFCGSPKIMPGYIRDGQEVHCTHCGARTHAFEPEAFSKAAAKWNARVVFMNSDRIAMLEAALREVRGCLLRYSREPMWGTECDSHIAQASEIVCAALSPERGKEGAAK
jgi:Lar family restriction alleviation protein